MLKKNNENKYLILDSTDEDKEPLKKKYSNVWSGIKNKTKEISVGECDYDKDFMNIKFNSNDDSLLNKPLKFHSVAIIIRSVFEENDILYLQVFYR